MMGIQLGEEVYFIGDPEKRVIVVDDILVKYGRTTTSLTGLARKFLGLPKRGNCGTSPLCVQRGPLKARDRGSNPNSNVKRDNRKFFKGVE